MFAKIGENLEEIAMLRPTVMFGQGFKQQPIQQPAAPTPKPVDEKKDWIKGAINPKHKGYCTPMSKDTCTPARKALAKRFKKGGDLHK